MSDTETQLRQLLDAATGVPPNSISVSRVRRLARRRRALHGIGAASCAAVSVLALGLAAPLVGGRYPQRPASAQHPVGVPRYYLQEPGIGNPPEALVRDTKTGRVTASVRCPWAGAKISGIAPTGDDAFFMTCQRITGSASQITAGSRLYRFRVTSTGSIPGYHLVPGGALPDLTTSGLTAAADGSAVAVSTAAIEPPTRTTDVLVINTRTGAHALWRTTSSHFSFSDFALSQDGRYLSFVRTPHIGSDVLVNDVVAEVSPASRGGQLSSARVLVHLRLGPTTFTYARISPAGSALTIAGFQLNFQRETGTMIVAQISVATGKVSRVLFRAGFSFRGAPGEGGRASSDPSGRYIIVTYGPVTDALNGWLDHGRLVPITPARGPFPGAETW